nr:GNAT family N-acetyltransferase [uncultured Intestinimonas sp.]
MTQESWRIARKTCAVQGAKDPQVGHVDMFQTSPSRHREDGPWQLIFGLATQPDCRRRGLAGQVLRRAADARAQGRRGMVLTCKEGLIPFYQSFGFENRGLSASVHGGAVWYDMVLAFPQEADAE